MAEITVTLPTFHADQQKAYEVARGARFFALRCGRRWGKTAFEKVVACDDAIHGKLVGWFAPDYKRLSEAFSEVETILAPIKKSSSQTTGIIRTITGGSVEFWTLGDESAGRSRKYHTALIDEAAFGKDNMVDIWRMSIKPTLLDYRGRCVAASNTKGVDPENFFWQICNEEKHGFVQYHAPSANNPYLPAEDIEELRRTEHPLVFQQEYLAEFVDFRGVAFFSLDNLLLHGSAVSLPMYCDAVLAVVDTAVKTGSDNDGTAVVYAAINLRGTAVGAAKITILDWDIQQIEGSLLDVWLPTVFDNLTALATQCKARAGSLGAWIEDKSSGMVLLQQAKRNEWPAHAIDTALTAKGKDERALSVSGYVYRGDVKLSQLAHDKVTFYKKTTRNHLISQVCGFRMGDKDASKRADDLLDCFTYLPSIVLGNSEGW